MILGIMIEGMVEIIIISFFNVRSAMYNSFGELLGFIQSSISLFLICVVLPLINITVIIISHFKGMGFTKNKTLNKYFGIIFEDYKKNYLINIFYPLIYEIRRILYIVIGLYFKN